LSPSSSTETPFDLRALLRPPIYLPVSATAYELLSALEQQHGQFAIVVGEYGGTAGIVSLEDLLEEVVGEVWDEFDVDLQEPVTVIAPGHLLAKGSARVDEVEALVALGEEAGDSTSIAGLMLANVDLPPRRGATVTFGDVVLRIEDVDGMTVESVTIRYPPERHTVGAGL
jgi:putative hemolysin